ncbi:MAG TPA: glutamate 5-kinase [Thermodesulfobacteriota bacterium]|nr:glutamate 5-kinase [Thermodesulfobacteriota bacterium]
MKKSERKSIISGVKRAIIKIGSSVLTDKKGSLSESMFDVLAQEISGIKSRGIEVVIVSSGAIASGMKKLNLSAKPSEISMKQAIAACGQSALIRNYERAFSSFGLIVAQILLTHDGLADRKRFLNARKTLNTLLDMGIIPVVNENDTVAVEEIMLGDNDNLAALVTSLVEADLLVLLTDIEGLYNKDPRKNEDAEFISIIESIGEEIESVAGDTLGRTTTGGMITKIQAARTAAAFGVPTIIANGKSGSALADIFDGKEVGTIFLPAKKILTGRKHWIAFTLKSAGELVLDGGAVRAITAQGKSLLPSGIKDVRGKFGVGDSVTCVDESGVPVARGLTSYGSDEIRRIMGLSTKDVEKTLGYKFTDEVIHRDDLAVIEKRSGR